jgi:hypothetical protein
MKRVVVFSVLAFVAGILLTAGGGVILLRQNPSKVLGAVGVKQSNVEQSQATQSVPEAQLTPEERHQRDFSVIFGDIINDLQPKQGFTLDHYALNNLITIDQNTIGMLHKITRDAENPQLRQMAEQ